MVLIDTNVVSELMRAAPNAEVLAWMDDLPARQLFVSAVTEAEVRTGIAVLPEGARRRVLADAAERTLSGLFAGRVLSFDSGAARAFAGIAAARRGAGRPISQSGGSHNRSAPPLGGKPWSANSGRSGPSCYSAGQPTGPNRPDRGSPNTEFLTSSENRIFASNMEKYGFSDDQPVIYSYAGQRFA